MFGSPRLRFFLLTGAFLTSCLVLGAALLLDSRMGVAMAGLTIAGLVLLLVTWGLWRIAQRFLWRVGRRLAFSYFLIGVLPIPMGIFLVLVSAYLVSGYFLGYLYRNQVVTLQTELLERADERARLFSRGLGPLDTNDGDVAFAYYRWDRRVSGSGETPERWPDWIRQKGNTDWKVRAPFYVLSDGRATLAGASEVDGFGVLAYYDGLLEAETARRTGIWTRLARTDPDDETARVSLQLGGTRFALQPLTAKRPGEGRSDFFGTGDTNPGLMDRPVLWWTELSGSLRSLADGEVVAQELAATLNTTPRTLAGHLFSSSAEINAAAWASLIGVAGLLSTIYGIAAVMALFMIFGISRAVNQLSRATTAVRGADFSRRIPVRRKDQIGELQRSFNAMTGHLESLVQTAAQQELIEKELRIARDLQESLVPADLPASEEVEFASLFEPSAAIGGDYFDILRVDDHRLAVVIADVSGHGLAAGLRMAMLKAALVILVQEGKRPEEILRRLNSIVRSEDRQRFFVTATITLVDFQNESMAITNAGHPPTYLLRNGQVEEFLLQGNPLGALGDTYGHREVPLEAGDTVVWLSDGLIEATDRDGEPFGYKAVRRALTGESRSASQVRDRLLAAVESHTGGEPADDDRTLVAMTYSPFAPSASRPRSE